MSIKGITEQEPPHFKAAEVPIELSEANESLDESLMDSISFSHRIEDAGIIAKVELIEEESAKKRLSMSISITNR